MGFLVTVTFDVNNVQLSPLGRNSYRTITDELDALDYTKYVVGKKKRKIDLPSNTYVAEFDDDDEGHQREFVDYVKNELLKIFTKHSLNGKYFICVGKSWAWKIGQF